MTETCALVQPFARPSHVQDRSGRSCRAAPAGSPFLLCQAQAFTGCRVNPFDEVFSRLDGPRAVDQGAAHVGLRDSAAFRPPRHAICPLLIQLDGDGRHSNTAILPCVSDVGAGPWTSTP